MSIPHPDCIGGHENPGVPISPWGRGARRPIPNNR
jgi:hypothetical protein